MQNTTKIAIILIAIIDYNPEKDKEYERYEERNIWRKTKYNINASIIAIITIIVRSKQFLNFFRIQHSNTLPIILISFHSIIGSSFLQRIFNILSKWWIQIPIQFILCIQIVLEILQSRMPADSSPLWL